MVDTCVWGKARSELEAAGHDVAWSGDWPSDPGDDEMLARAYAEQRIVVTLDKDFGELAIVHGRPHRGIVRLVGISARQQASICIRVLASHGAELEAGGIVTAELGRLRVRPADSATS